MCSPLDRFPVLRGGALDLVVAVAVVLHVFELVGQILLLHPMVRVGVRVLVVLPLRAAGRIGVDILEAAREVAALARFHVRPSSADALDHAVGLRCGGEQHRRLRQRQLRFGRPPSEDWTRLYWTGSFESRCSASSFETVAVYSGNTER